MKLTSLLQVVEKLEKAGEIDNLSQVYGVFGRALWSSLRRPCTCVITRVSKAVFIITAKEN